MMKSNLLLLLSVLFATAQAWELPSFLFDNLPQPQSPLNADVASKNEDRNLQTTTKGGSSVNATVADSPTAMPTESPAPSPSPSEIPTAEPTVTAKPTPLPTAMPTESPAPSPSPSETPTAAPSDSPSESPSSYPTVSSMPSTIPSATPTNQPSDSPSVAPTPYPTISAAPSDVPSVSPSDQPSVSPSAAPSSSPTRITSVSVNYTLTLPLETGQLNTTQLTALTASFATFLETKVELEGGRLEDVNMTVKKQESVEVVQNVASNTANSTGRALVLWSELSLAQDLVLETSVEATYIGSDNYFNLSTSLDSVMKTKSDDLYALLAGSDVVFATLSNSPVNENGVPKTTTSAAVTEDTKARGAGISNGAVATVVILAMAAIGLGVAATVFSIRSHRKRAYGTELYSPRMSCSTGLGSRLADENQAEYTRELTTDDREIFQTDTCDESDAKQSQGDSASLSWAKQKEPPLSPNSLERGGTVSIADIIPKQPNPVEPTRKDDSWSYIRQVFSANTASDPPTGTTEVDYPAKRAASASYFITNSLLDSNVSNKFECHIL
jgi:hypothetical protein